MWHHHHNRKIFKKDNITIESINIIHNKVGTAIYGTILDSTVCRYRISCCCILLYYTLSSSWSFIYCTDAKNTSYWDFCDQDDSSKDQEGDLDDFDAKLMYMLFESASLLNDVNKLSVEASKFVENRFKKKQYANRHNEKRNIIEMEMSN